MFDDTLEQSFASTQDIAGPIAIDFEKALNPQQYAAVTAGDGPVLVLAGAGSGKTRTLTYRVAYLLSKRVKPWEILLLTFTNKAAKEMLNRVEDLTGVTRDQFWGGTFHHIGQRVLRSHGGVVGLERSFTIMDESDAEALLGKVIKEVDGEFLVLKDNPRAKFLRDAFSYARNTGMAVNKVFVDKYPFYEHLAERANEFYKVYQQRKKELQVVDYDDLLEYWLKAMEESEEVASMYQNKFKYVLVDEYQDTNWIQSKIIDKVAKAHQIMAVGDDAQCIYTWRGADLDNILSFPQRHPGTVIYKIETNYRSTPEILSFANSVLEGQSKGYDKQLKAVKRQKQKPYYVTLENSEHQGEFIAKRIEGLLSEGYAYKDIAILYRAHFQAMDMQMELTKQGIPFTITSGLRFFEQAHVKDLVAQLRFAWNSEDTVSFTRVAMLLPKVGEKTAERLLKLAVKLGKEEGCSTIDALTHEKVLASVPQDARDEWKDMSYVLQDVQEAMHVEKPVKKVEKATEDLFDYFAQKEKREMLQQSAPVAANAVIMTPTEIVQMAIEGWYGDYLRHVYTNWETRTEDLNGVASFASRFDDVGEFLSQLVLLNAETTEKSVEVDEDTVRLTTVHQAKGLEFPVVFVIGLAEGLFPLKRAIDAGDVEEERRLFYVAVTRAQEELYLTYPMRGYDNYGTHQGTPTRFIFEVPEHKYQALRAPKKRNTWM